MITALIICIGILAFLLIVFTIINHDSFEVDFDDEEKKLAGDIGEEIAYEFISEVADETDHIFRNVILDKAGNRAEMDFIIVNTTGVYIIEAKNYVGEIYGEKEDYDWIKVKETDSGNIYETTLKNPIKQVNRQIFYLSGLFKENNIRAWIDGYVVFINGNSPIVDNQIISSKVELEYAIHQSHEVTLTDETINRIRLLLS